MIAGKKEAKLDSGSPGPGAYEPMLSYVNNKAPTHLLLYILICGVGTYEGGVGSGPVSEMTS